MHNIPNGIENIDERNEEAEEPKYSAQVINHLMFGVTENKAKIKHTQKKDDDEEGKENGEQKFSNKIEGNTTNLT